MSLTIRGETHFELVGFLIQLASILSESLRITLQGVVLQGKKLDPLSYVLIVSPLCFTFLGAMLACHNLVVEIPVIDVPTFATINDRSGILLLNALIALALNLTTATFIGCTSAVAFTLVNIIKDSTIVVFSSLAQGNHLSAMQFIGFSLQLPLIMCYAYVKTSPDLPEERPLLSKPDSLFSRHSSSQSLEWLKGLTGN